MSAMHGNRFFGLLPAGLASVVLASAAALAAEPGPIPGREPGKVDAPLPAAPGPLRVCPENPRYFADPAGKAVFLAGSHTWGNLADMGKTDPPPAFDFDAYLDFLVRHHHNFFRLWTWELPRNSAGERRDRWYVSPSPWARTGPGPALDGKPRFDLTRFDPEYFGRLRDRTAAAGRRGIYVSVMLFEGYALQFSPELWRWRADPFHPENNVNGVDGDPDGTGKGLAIHTLAVPAVTRIQEAYVRKVVDTVGDLDNVLFEVCNEAGGYSTEWQYHMIRFVKECEAARPKKHPVGMTVQYQGGSNRVLWESLADWISPNSEAPGHDYRDDPPPADGRKVVVSDTDHLWGVGGNPAWAWKSLCRGHNLLFMDPYRYDEVEHSFTDRTQPRWDPIREAMGRARLLAERMDLARARPAGELASTGYCLAQPGSRYLVYLPQGGTASVDLSAAPGRFSAEWYGPKTGESRSAPPVEGGASRHFKPPFEGDAVLFIAAHAPGGS